MRLRPLHLLAGTLLAVAATSHTVQAEEGPELPGLGGSEPAVTDSISPSPSVPREPEMPTENSSVYQPPDTDDRPVYQPPQDPLVPQDSADREVPKTTRPKSRLNGPAPKAENVKSSSPEARAKAARDAWMRKQSQSRSGRSGQAAPSNQPLPRKSSASAGKNTPTEGAASSRSTGEPGAPSASSSRSKSSLANRGNAKQAAPREPQPSAPWRDDPNWLKRGTVKARPALNKPSQVDAQSQAQAKPQAQAQPKSKGWPLPTWPGKPRSSSNAKPTQSR